MDSKYHLIAKFETLGPSKNIIVRNDESSAWKTIVLRVNGSSAVRKFCSHSKNESQDVSKTTHEAFARQLITC